METRTGLEQIGDQIHRLETLPVTLILSHMQSIEKKTDKLQEQHVSIISCMAVQNAELKEHTRRSTQLEAQLGPIKNHVNRVDGALRLFGLMCAVVGAVAAMAKLFS